MIITWGNYKIIKKTFITCHYIILHKMTCNYVIITFNKNIFTLNYMKNTWDFSFNYNQITCPCNFHVNIREFQRNSTCATYPPTSDNGGVRHYMRKTHVITQPFHKHVMKSAFPVKIMYFLWNYIGLHEPKIVTWFLHEPKSITWLLHGIKRHYMCYMSNCITNLSYMTFTCFSNTLHANYMYFTWYYMDFMNIFAYFHFYQMWPLVFVFLLVPSQPVECSREY